MYFLGLDVGTGGSRAIVIDAEGSVISSAVVDHEAFSSPQTGWAEQDPEDWWRASSEAIRAATKTLSNPDAIAAVGLTGQMHGSVLLDADDRVVRPALLWCDQRTSRECTDIEAAVGAERLIELVSNPAITGFTLPKLLWTRRHEPELWNRTTSILLPKDYVRLCLTGDKASDVADASGTLLFDVKNRAWSRPMLEILEIDGGLLPKVFESLEITGTVTAAGSEATGLRQGTPVVAGAGDNAAGAIGMGVVTPGTVSSTIGTSGVVFVATDRPTVDPEGRTHTLCHAIPGRWHMTGVTLAAGLSMKWFRENFAAGADFFALDREAASVPAGSDGALWLPYLMGERTPHLDPAARAAFVGLTAGHTQAHLTRAVMEGVAFSLRDALEIFRSLGVPIERIRLGGGGARSGLWRQIQADVFGQGVETISVDEGATLGAAILAAVGVGAFHSVDEACGTIVKPAETIQSDSDAANVLDQRYQTYRRLYPALRDAMPN